MDDGRFLIRLLFIRYLILRHILYSFLYISLAAQTRLTISDRRTT
jgi:hypothetical protein